MSSSPQIEQARAIATRAHDGQVDKIGAPYITHPAMVAAFVQVLPDFAAQPPSVQEDAIAAAWLHDVIEDTGETEGSLAAAGISPAAVEAVVALTRTEDVPLDDYYGTIRSLPLARLVKTADLASDLAPERVAKLDEATRERLAAKYTHALVALGVDPSVIAAVQEATSRSGLR